jgi:hypothetical protein
MFVTRMQRKVLLVGTLERNVTVDEPLGGSETPDQTVLVLPGTDVGWWVQGDVLVTRKGYGWQALIVTHGDGIEHVGSTA